MIRSLAQLQNPSRPLMYTRFHEAPSLPIQNAEQGDFAGGTPSSSSLSSPAKIRFVHLDIVAQEQIVIGGMGQDGDGKIETNNINVIIMAKLKQICNIFKDNKSKEVKKMNGYVYFDSGTAFAQKYLVMIQEMISNEINIFGFYFPTEIILLYI